MQVIYAASGITEKVDEAIRNADILNREIEKIVLSKEDFTDLYNDNYEWSPSGRGSPSKNVGNYSPFRYKGVLIEVEEQSEAAPTDSLAEISPADLEEGLEELLFTLFGNNK